MVCCMYMSFCPSHQTNKHNFGGFIAKNGDDNAIEDECQESRDHGWFDTIGLPLVNHNCPLPHPR